MWDWEAMNATIMRRFPQYTFDDLYHAPLKLVFWLHSLCPDDERA